MFCLFDHAYPRRNKSTTLNFLFVGGHGQRRCGGGSYDGQRLTVDDGGSMAGGGSVGVLVAVAAVLAPS
jgi:hypothetical protein